VAKGVKKAWFEVLEGFKPEVSPNSGFSSPSSSIGGTISPKEVYQAPSVKRTRWWPRPFNRKINILS